jgi:hypothetical protein
MLSREDGKTIKDLVILKKIKGKKILSGLPTFITIDLTKEKLLLLL